MIVAGLARRLSPLALVLGLAGGSARAAQVCPFPAALVPAPVQPVRPEEIVSGVKVTAYVLSLMWVPEWRRTDATADKPSLDPALRPQGFALHGLWPDGAAPPYPRFCRPVGQVDRATVAAMYCRTPSAHLIQHEWQAHGACHWASAAAYFADAGQLYDAVRVPRIEALHPATAGAVRQAFVDANPALQPADIFIDADREGRLKEVRLCYDLAKTPVACPGGDGDADDGVLTVTPSATGSF